MEKKLKLNFLAENNLKEKEMSNVRGGTEFRCGCGCNYAGSGGSSTGDNMAANYDGGLHSASNNAWVEDAG